MNPAAAALLIACFLAACGDSPTGPGTGSVADPLRALAVGEGHACLLTADGTAHCWGRNSEGQLGNSSLANSAVPVRVSGGHTFVAITAGGDHTCALTAAGAAFCWGSNRHGQLGTGAATGEWEPVRVAGGLTFSALSAGGYQHTCGRTTTGELYCWGGDRDGQLGFAAPDSCFLGAAPLACSRAPARVDVAGSWAGVSAGFLHTCAWRADGAAYCWGSNSAGQLGTGETGSATRPTAVAGGLRFATVSSGSVHSCALDDAGRPYCWGDNAARSLGVPGTTSSPVPLGAAAGQQFQRLSTSAGNTQWGHSCAVSADGRIHCWGANDTGQLGTSGTLPLCQTSVGVVPCSDAPRLVAGTEQWLLVAAGAHFTCASTTAGVPYCWGLNSSGQLGSGGTAGTATPLPVAGGLRLPRAPS